MRLSRTGSRPPLVLHASPVHEVDGEPGQARIGALVLVIDPAWRSEIDPERVAGLLGLTPVESRVVALLAQSKPIDDIA